ncbi:MAG: hypothetical protein JWQ68_410 [Cryobacterium sp.]|jgi:hypothetical protein|nr:hypothetical protein [Cryobacterium sp.]
MKGKILFLAGAAAGYVFGSKAGRQAYEQIKAQAQKVWTDPAVQKTVGQASQAAKDAAAAAQAKISEAVGHGPSGDSNGASKDAPTTEVHPGESPADTSESGTSSSGAADESDTGGTTPTPQV